MNKDKRSAAGRTLLKIINSQSDEFVTKTSAGMGEDGTGQYLTYNELIDAILGANFMEGTLYAETMKFNVSDKAHGMKVPIVDQTARTVGDGILGGVIDYEMDEGTTVTLSKPKFAQSELPLVQTGIAVAVTNALKQDTNVLVKFLGEGIKERMRFRLDREILYGTGVRGIYGVGKSGVGTRATKKVTNAVPITVTNMRDMVGYYYGGKNGCWVMAQDAWQEIINLHSSSTYPTFPLHFTENGEALLFGFPVYVSDVMDSRDICLGDFTAFIIGQKEIKEDVSEHLYFSSNQSLFRTIIRVCGITGWSAPIKGQDGALRYAYVFSDAGASNSSSSSSSSSQSSESSSSSSYWANWSSSSSSSSSYSSGSSSTESSSSESSHAKVGCYEDYCASAFTTDTLNGTYGWAGKVNGKPYYENAHGKYLWANSGSTWVISNYINEGYSNWLSYSNGASSCPETNNFIGQDTGTITGGKC